MQVAVVPDGDEVVVLEKATVVLVALCLMEVVVVRDGEEVVVLERMTVVLVVLDLVEVVVVRDGEEILVLERATVVLVPVEDAIAWAPAPFTIQCAPFARLAPAANPDPM